MERDTPLAILVRKLKAIIPDDPLANVPKGLPAKTLEAYRKGNSFLESIALSATEGSNIQISLMNEGRRRSCRRCHLTDFHPGWKPCNLTTAEPIVIP